MVDVDGLGADLRANLARRRGRVRSHLDAHDGGGDVAVVGTRVAAAVALDHSINGNGASASARIAKTFSVMATSA